MSTRTLSSRIVELITKLDKENPAMLLRIPTEWKRFIGRSVIARFGPSDDDPLYLDGILFVGAGPAKHRMWIAEDNVLLRRVLESHLYPGMAAVDVGANVGYHTLVAARAVGPKGRVYAVEPAKYNIEVLKKNVLINQFGNVVIIPFAAGSHHEERDFWLRHVGHSEQRNSFYPDHVDVANATVTVEKVQVAPLDDLIEGNVDLVKLDVEGAELEALAGMTRLLRNPSVQLIVEWHPLLQIASGNGAIDLPMFLQSQGFELHQVDHRNLTRLERPQFDSLASSLIDNEQFVDLYAYRA